MDIYGTIESRNNLNGALDVGGLIDGGGGASDFDTKIIPYDNRITANENNITALQTEVDSLDSITESLTDDVNENIRDIEALESGKADKREIPNVPSWAMQSNKPSYNASEITNNSSVTGQTVKDALENISSGASVKNITTTEYNELSEAEKKDGSIYFVDGTYITVNYDMNNTQVYKESSMSLTSTQNTSIIKWNGGSNIGFNYYYTTSLNLDSITKINYNLVTRNCYGNGATAQQTRWYINVALMRTPPSSIGDPNHSNMLAYNEYPNSNTEFNNQEIDTSELTGVAYLVVYAHGWNATLSNLTYTEGDFTHNIYYMDKKYT